MFRILSKVEEKQLRRRTKILCTIGPASYKRETMKDLMLNGMDVARLNFSHGSRRGFAKMIKVLKEVAESIGHQHFALLQDLQGPKIRVGKLKNRELYVATGDKFEITTKNDYDGGYDGFGCTYPNFAKDAIVGKDIFIDDGKLQFKVISKDEGTVTVETIIGGMIFENKGINMPNMPLSSDILTEKDRLDLKFGLEQKMDYVCLSFVSKPEDLLLVDKLMRDPEFNPSGYTCPIIAKIERQEAVDCLEEIVKTAGKLGGGLMVARGDLAVETGYCNLPIIQKRIISECMKYGCLVITATEMLITMCKNHLPSRAEVCDVANAILDHSSVLMLSNETAMGKYPVESVKMMQDISIETDSKFAEFSRMYHKVGDFEYYDNSYEIILVGGKIMAKKHRKCKCVVIFTHSGFTASKFSAQRLNKPVFAFTDNLQTLRRLSLIWGCIPVLCSVLKFDEKAVKGFLMEVFANCFHNSLDPEKDAFVFISGGRVDPKYTVRLLSFKDEQEQEEGGEQEEEEEEVFVQEKKKE